ncbi:hypothetical protein BTZ20_4480 [Rhodococcus sp. MTM3W5.2]|nr:hypothetical protein BTZ20_4480 [Rhodococcus sp. MTM3W5.2]
MGSDLAYLGFVLVLKLLQADPVEHLSQLLFLTDLVIRREWGFSSLSTRAP